MNEKIKEQILVIRDTGLTNMFDVAMVKTLAVELEMPELAAFLETDAKAYTHFILTGESE